MSRKPWPKVLIPKPINLGSRVAPNDKGGAHFPTSWCL